ncbi:MAG TPA: hypothetical protein VNC50_00955 [Planctomycetia bacterium]|nr:hypothetical protein [Planctomycetia bacterium]
MIRWIIGGLLGGVVVFFAAFINHMVFEFGDRRIGRLQREDDVQEFFVRQKLTPGFYHLPQRSEDYKRLSPEKQKEQDARLNEAFREGPAVTIVVRPTGGDMMSPKVLGTEFGSNVAAALLAALVASQIAGGFVARWFTVLLMGIFAWASIDASYYIWDGFPLPFVLDQLLMAAIEWGAAGLVIAAVVRPPKPVETLTPA